LYFDMSLGFSQRHFYSFQMFEARPSVLDLKTLTTGSFDSVGRVGFVLGYDKLSALKDFAARYRASVTHLVDLESRNAGLMLVDFDARGRARVPTTPDRAMIVRGAHAEEQAEGTYFRWMEAEAEIVVMLTEAREACVSIAFFSSGQSQSSESVVIRGPGIGTRNVDIAGTSRRMPRRIQVRIDIKDGRASMRLQTAMPPARFPGDSRQIFYGIVLPIALIPVTACHE
jgi:hypothetical protein